MVSRTPIIAAIGNFDGVHLGHQYLLQETARFAIRHGASSGVIVFEPHPRRYFRPDDPPFLLTMPAQRDAMLRACGADEVMALRFDEALASLSPEAFVNSVLRDQLGLAGAVTGADFRFGAKRAGDGAALQSLGKAAGLNIHLVDVLADNSAEEKFGSSAVREALQAGDVKRAAAMLGRPWAVRGSIVEGQKLGRTLGFPTANMTLGDYIEPRRGVYAVTATLDGATYKGVANFGRRPTVGSDAPRLETHLFDFDGDLYGKTIEIAFVDFIRDEKKFDGLDALKAQIEKDMTTSKETLNRD
ncbi:MAG: bifunctional riboflavin kinase/FAD synthetase [Pseudomonadota bacterium]